MIDVDRIQTSVSAPTHLEALLAEQLAVIKSEDRLWAWSPLNLLLRQALVDTRLNELLKVGSRCLSAEKIGLCYHLVVGVDVATEKSVSAEVGFHIHIIADCFEVSIADINCVVKTSCMSVSIVASPST